MAGGLELASSGYRDLRRFRRGAAQATSSVDFGTRVSVQSITFISSTQLTVQIKVHPKAATGSRNVTVTNPDTSTATCAGCFNVGSSPASATSAQTSAPSQSSALSDNDETPTDITVVQPTDPTLLIVELVLIEEESDDESPTEDDTEILPVDQADLDSLFGDLNDSLQEELLTV